MSKSKHTGSVPNHSKQRAKRQQRQAAHRRKHWRHKQELKRLATRRATEEPQPTPTARGYLGQRFWEALQLDEALERVGIAKSGGISIGCVLLVVLLFGIMNVQSLSSLAEAIGQDVALCAVLGIQSLEAKILYRTLSAISVPQYQTWMKEILQALQRNPRTASQCAGVVAGDETPVAKPYGPHMPGVRMIYMHSSKVFSLGYDIASTHYADWEKNYPLFCAIYQPNEAKQAEIIAERERKELQIDRRKATDIIRWLKHQVEQQNAPPLVELSGNQLTAKLRQQIEQELQLPWVGISGQHRVYTLQGEASAHNTKALLRRDLDHCWIELPDLGCRIAFLGPATCSLGEVLLVVGEYMDAPGRQLYVLPRQEQAQAVEKMSWVLRRAQEGPPPGKLHLMLDLLRLSREAGIRAQTAVFDGWYWVPWFLNAVLKLGFKRAVVPAKNGLRYVYKEQGYGLEELWALWREKDFVSLTYREKPYRLLSRTVCITELGAVQLVFVHVLCPRGRILRHLVLLCTDLRYPPLDVLRAYLLRWKIEVCYRECKQNHGLGQFHARTFETIYGQLLMSFLAYLCVTVTRLLTKTLQHKTLGWIKRHYFNSLVHLGRLPSGELVIELSGALLDDYGLPDFCFT